ncbi:MAG: hypothetical protein Q8S01_03090 [Ignavibacteria bacterium]|nr:hypothetical protein [Ignavibacteria bacterium]
MKIEAFSPENTARCQNREEIIIVSRLVRCGKYYSRFFAPIYGIYVSNTPKKYHQIH